MNKLKISALLLLIASFGSVCLIYGSTILDDSKEIAIVSESAVTDDCTICEQQLNGCYVFAGTRLRCNNGDFADYVLMSDGNWCYDNTRGPGGCQVNCPSICF